VKVKDPEYFTNLDKSKKSGEDDNRALTKVTPGLSDDDLFTMLGIYG
jgi:hypothetical protein